MQAHNIKCTQMENQAPSLTLDFKKISLWNQNLPVCCDAIS